MRILIISHFYAPERGAAAARISGLAYWLSKRGHSITIQTGFPNYPGGRIYEGYRRSMVSRDQQAESHRGIRVFRNYITEWSRSRRISRILNHLSFVASSFFSSLRLVKYQDLILISSPPLLSAMTAILLSRVNRIPLIADIRDLWPDIAVDMGEWGTDSLAARLARRLANSLYQSASLITPVTQRKREKLLSQAIPDSKLRVVYNGIDTSRLAVEPDRNWKAEFGLQGKQVILYAGLIGIAQGLDKIVTLANMLKDMEDVHFLVIGDGVEREHILSLARDLDPGNIQFMGPQPSETIPAIIKAMDVCIVPLVSEALDDAVPSKLLEAWGCKKPVLLLAQGESADLVEQCEGGFVASPNNLEPQIAGIRSFLADHGTLESMGKRGYDYVHENFQREKLTQILEEALSNIDCRG